MVLLWLNLKNIHVRRYRVCPLCHIIQTIKDINERKIGHHYPLLYCVCLNMIFYNQYKAFKLCTQPEPCNVKFLLRILSKYIFQIQSLPNDVITFSISILLPLTCLYSVFEIIQSCSKVPQEINV